MPPCTRNAQYTYPLDPLRRLAPWAKQMRMDQHKSKAGRQLRVGGQSDLFDGWDTGMFRLYHRYLDVESGLSWLGRHFWNQGRLSVLCRADGDNWCALHRGIGYVYWALRVHGGIREMAHWRVQAK